MFDLNTPEGAAAMQRLGLGMMAAGAQGKGLGSAFGVAGLDAQGYYEQLIQQKIAREQQKHASEMADKRMALDQRQADAQYKHYDAQYKHQDAMLSNAERQAGMKQQEMEMEAARKEKLLGAAQSYQQKYMDMKPVQEGMAGPPQLLADRRTPGMIAGIAGLEAGIGTPEQQAKMLQQSMGLGAGLDAQQSIPAEILVHKYWQSLDEKNREEFDLRHRNDNRLTSINGVRQLVDTADGRTMALTTPEAEAAGQGTVAAGIKAAQIGAEDRTNAAIALPKAKATVDTNIAMLDELANHPALDYYAGIQSKVPGVKQALEMVPEVQDFLSRQDQVGSQAWLTGFIDNMKNSGAGAFTNVEGEQMRAAQARLNQAVGKENYLKALEDYKRVLLVTYENAVKRSQGNRTPGSQLGRSTEPSPNIPARATLKATPNKAPHELTDEELKQSLGL